MAEDGQRAYTVPEVAELLQVHSATVRRLIDRGELEGIYVGRLLRIMPEDLAAYVQRSRSSRRSHDDTPEEKPPDASR